MAVLKTRSFPFSVITPLLRTHFHRFLVCETCAAPSQLCEQNKKRGSCLVELRQHEVIRLGLVPI